jgi:hypothetical protein
MRRHFVNWSLLLFIRQISTAFSVFVHHYSTELSFLPRDPVMSKMSLFDTKRVQFQNHGPKMLSRSSSVGVLALHSLQEDEDGQDSTTKNMRTTNHVVSDTMHTSSCPALLTLEVSNEILTDNLSNMDNVSIVSTDVSLASFADDLEEGASTSSSSFLVEKVELNSLIPTSHGQSSAKSLAERLVSTV